MWIVRKFVAVILVVAFLAMFAFTKGSKVDVDCGPHVSYAATYSGIKHAEKAGEFLGHLKDGDWSPLEVYRTVKGMLDTIELWWAALRASALGEPTPPLVSEWEQQQQSDAQAAAAACCPAIPAPSTPQPGGGTTPFDPKNLSITTGSSSALTAEQVARQAAMRYWPVSEVDTAVAVAEAESGFDPTVENASHHRGLWQVNQQASDGHDWRDPNVNAALAYRIWKDIGWSRGWTTYSSGKYKEFLRPASKLTAAVASGSTTDAASAIQALGKADGASPITPHTDPQGLPAFDLMSTGATRDKIAETIRSNPTAYGARYVIANMQIASPKSDWAWRPYSPITGSGDFRHVNHVHVSYTPGPVQPLTSAAAGSGSPNGAQVGCTSGAMPAFRVGTWNGYYGPKHPGTSGPSGEARIRKGIRQLADQTDAFGLQEFSEQSHKDWAKAELGDGWGWVGFETAHPIAYNKSALSLVGQGVDPIFERTDDYEGPSQGNRAVVHADLQATNGQRVRLVNMHQLPKIQKGGLNTAWPKRIAIAKKLWARALGLAVEGKQFGASIVVGDMNYDGDPDGMYAAAGMTQASSLFPDIAQQSRKRDIDQFLFSAGLPSSEKILPPNGSDHQPRVLTFPGTAGTAAVPSIAGLSTVGMNFPGQNTADQALAWMQAHEGQNWTDRCLAAVGRAYGHQGTTPVNGHFYATGQWDAMPAKYRHQDGSLPPRGALVFWKSSNVAGHIALSAGGGKVWSTYAPGHDGIGLVDIDAVDAIGPRLGWSEPYFIGKTNAGAAA